MIGEKVTKIIPCPAKFVERNNLHCHLETMNDR